MQLKKLLTATLLVVTTTAFSQVLSIGPRAGGTLTKFGGLKDASYKAGTTFGAFLVYSKREHFGIGIEILYSGDGSIHENTILTDKYEYETRLHYLRVPILATYFFNQAGDDLRPKISFGPSVGYLMGTQQNITITRNGNEVTKYENTSLDNYNSLDYGLTFGAGFNFKMQSRIWLNADARYNYGFANILKNSAYGSDEANNMGASFSLGLAFGIDKPKIK